MQLEQRVRAVVERCATVRAEAATGSGANMLDAYGLDSLSIANLLADLEEEFRISIELEDVSFETFASIGTLTELVRRKTRDG